MKWPWKKRVPEQDPRIDAILNRLGGIEAIQTQILKYVTPAPLQNREVPGVGAVGGYRTKHRIGE